MDPKDVLKNFTIHCPAGVVSAWGTSYALEAMAGPELETLALMVTYDTDGCYDAARDPAVRQEIHDHLRTTARMFYCAEMTLADGTPFPREQMDDITERFKSLVGLEAGRRLGAYTLTGDGWIDPDRNTLNAEAGPEARAGN